MTKVTHIVDLHTCIQGEGKYAGIPHILIRLSGCNLNCQFKDSICDTSYASWRPEKGTYLLEDVEKILVKNPQIKHSFITGGEPTIYPDELCEIYRLLKSYNHFVSIETNGTNEISCTFDFLSISPKMRNSTPIPGSIINDDYISVTVKETDKKTHEAKRINLPVLKQLTNKNNYQLKFVVSVFDDLEEIQELQNTLKIPSSNIFLMPEGISQKQLNDKRKWLIELCINHGYNFSDRLHIIAYGNKRDA